MTKTNRRTFLAGAATLGTGALASCVSSTPEAAPAETLDARTSFTVIYPNHEGARFDYDYYRDTHVPLVSDVMGAKKAIMVAGEGINGASAPYAMILHLLFESPDALQAGLAQPGMTDVQGDVVNFTDIKPTALFGKLL